MQNFNLDSEFYCCNCGHKGIPIIRKRGSEREAGHLKKIYCLHCNKEFNHVECKPYTHYTHEDFLIEFNNHNFDKDGNRIMSYGELKEKIRKGL